MDDIFVLQANAISFLLRKEIKLVTFFSLSSSYPTKLITPQTIGLYDKQNIYCLQELSLLVRCYSIYRISNLKSQSQLCFTLTIGLVYLVLICVCLDASSGVTMVIFHFFILILLLIWSYIYTIFLHFNSYI